MILCDHRLVVPWECRCTSRGHAVVNQLLDSGEKPMAMENSDMVMPTYSNPGRLEMADIAEPGTDVPSRGLKGHVTEGYVVAHMPVKLARLKVTGVLANRLPVSEEQIISSLVLRVVTEAQGC